MKIEIAKRLFGRIYEYFQYQESPSDDQIALWHHKIKHIPDEAAKWMLERITEHDKVPRNIPKEMLELWPKWRQANRHKIASEQMQYCDDCGGHGTHLFRKINYDYSPPMKIQYIAMCSKCDNWQKHFGIVCREGGYIHRKTSQGTWEPMLDKWVDKVPAISRQEIIDNGWDYVDQHSPREKTIKVERSQIDRLADRIAQ